MPVYVDESVRSGRYLLCAVLVADARLESTRQTLRGLRKAGQRRIHMKHEGDRRRREILSAVTALGLEARVYDSELGHRSARTARDDCLRALIADLVRDGVAQVVIESCDMDHADNQVIREVLLKEAAEAKLAYRHATPLTETLLWLPDVLAWAYGRRGDWRRRVDSAVTAVTRLGR